MAVVLVAIVTPAVWALAADGAAAEIGLFALRTAIRYPVTTALLTGGANAAANNDSLNSIELQEVRIASGESEQVEQGLSRAITAADKDIEHLLKRHGFGTTTPNAGKFASDVDIPQMIKSAVDYGGIALNTLGRAGYQFTLPFVRSIGLDINGKLAYNIMVVIMPSGALKTAFPF